MKTKFKTGDRVKVKRFRKRPSNWNSDGLMDHLMGKIVEIKKYYPYTSKISYEIYDKQHDRTWLVYETQVEPVDEAIVIYRKDNEVVAFDKLTGEKGIARCNPEDTFDFKTGAKIAFDRLMDMYDHIEVGDAVKIVDTGRLYTTNIDWFIVNAINPELLGKYAFNDNLGYIRGSKAPGDTFIVAAMVCDMAVVQNSISQLCYLIDIEGLKKC